MQAFRLSYVPAIFAATPVLAQDQAAEAVGSALGGLIGIVILIIIGAVVGWLASLLVKGSGSGFWSDVLIGIGGALIAGYGLPLVGISLGGIVGSFFAALLGAIIFLLIIRTVRRA